MACIQQLLKLLTLQRYRRLKVFVLLPLLGSGAVDTESYGRCAIPVF